MTEEAAKKLLDTISTDSEYAKRLAKANDTASLTALLGEIGISVTDDEAAIILQQAEERYSSEELDEAALDDVSGGIGYLAACALAGGGVGLAVGLAAVGIYYLWRKYGR